MNEIKRSNAVPFAFPTTPIPPKPSVPTPQNMGDIDEFVEAVQEQKTWEQTIALLRPEHSAIINGDWKRVIAPDMPDQFMTGVQYLQLKWQNGAQTISVLFYGAGNVSTSEQAGTSPDDLYQLVAVYKADGWKQIATIQLKDESAYWAYLERTSVVG